MTSNVFPVSYIEPCFLLSSPRLVFSLHLVLLAPVNSFIHSFIHCRHLYSASSNGTTQKRSQPQCGQIMFFKLLKEFSGGRWLQKPFNCSFICSFVSVSRRELLIIDMFLFYTLHCIIK